MSIPYWRTVKGTDDGCDIYECLNCYCTWEARTPPWHEYEGKRSYRVKWRMCPVCGCHWVGKKETKENGYDEYGYKGLPNDNNTRLYPCRFKIMETFHTLPEDEVCSKDCYLSRIEDPVYALEKVKALREKEQDRLFGYYTYHIEKEKENGRK